MANFNIFGKPYNDTTGISLIDTNGNTHEFYDYESFGTKTITSNGEYSPWDDGYSAYSVVTVNVSGGGSPSLQNKSVTPALYAQVVQADSGYDGLGTVAVGAMPSGTAGTPTATKGTVSNHSISVTPSVTNTTGYITGSTKTGTAVTVSASELVSGSETKTANGTYDVTNLSQLVVNVSGGGSSAWTKVAETSYQVSTTGTSATTHATWSTGHSELWTTDKWVYVRIRDTAGKRAGYFYGSDNFFLVPFSGTSTTFSGRFYERYTTNGIYEFSASSTTTGYGVYADTLYSDGRIRIRKRYSSSTSLTINGTYKVEVYLLDPAGGVPIFG